MATSTIHGVMPECSFESVSTPIKRTLRNMTEPLIVLRVYSDVLTAHASPVFLSTLFAELPEQSRWMLANVSFLLYLIKSQPTSTTRPTTSRSASARW